jgi:nucleotide-binding universal stress UspA family protein
MDKAPVVVGLDGSPCGRAALRYGIAEAQRLDTALELVYAPQWPYLDGTLDWWSGRDPGEQPLSEGFAAVRARAPELVVTATVADGTAAEALIDRSATAAVVVVGAHGAPGFPALHLGATSVQVALHATGPVVVVPAASDDPDGPVVVGVDESQNAGPALWYALRAASLRGAELDAVYAWQPPRPHWPHRVQPLPASFADLQALHRKALDAALDRWRGAFPAVPVHPRLLPGEPAPTLVAASVRAGLLVVGAHGMDALRGSASVARSVLERARCPVAVVHPHRHARTDHARTDLERSIGPKVPARR